MSTTLLQELHQETRRLYIAGSDLAAGDFRLKRLLPQFRQLGERSAVFKRIGEGIAALVEPEASAEPPAVKLQELALLLESVLYTQGTSTPEGSPGPIETVPVRTRTTLAYRRLAPIRDALTTSGGGRYEIIMEAYKEGAFQDLRLLPLAIGALDDPYSEIADYAMTTILPSYGQDIAGVLAGQLDLQGGKNDVRKLKVIGAAGGPEWRGLLLSAAKDGKEAIRTTAIEFLAGEADVVPLLLEWSRESRSAIRKAAYAALAEGGSVEGEERIMEAFAGKDREAAGEAVCGKVSAGLARRLTALFHTELNQVEAPPKDGKDSEKLWSRLQPFITALRGLQSPELLEAYRHVLRNYKRFAPVGGSSLLTRAASYVEKHGTYEDLQLMQELEREHVVYAHQHFHLARRLLAPAELYHSFAGSLLETLKNLGSKRKNQREHILLDAIEALVLRREWRQVERVWEGSGFYNSLDYLMPGEEELDTWDARWLDWFVARGSLKLTAAFARPGHSGAQSFMLKHLGTLEQRDRNELVPILFQGLERTGMPLPERQELLVSLLEQEKRYYRPYDFDGVLFGMLLELPASYAGRIEALLPRYQYEARKQLAYVLGQVQAMA
ncbi:HEAT repeat domain-containing protein ['Paenibacillus yunnanensis' Narsing Rao et al. 2020]|uniref:HEAT repeat domain-containing protein n=1 Tax=Paenibacillus tengchongensis TaxID=2608684 RepID=UPI00124D468B|nr:HEAT repeat domain-containing protein [Paenibacillus tengchongensis]